MLKTLSVLTLFCAPVILLGQAGVESPMKSMTCCKKDSAATMEKSCGDMATLSKQDIKGRLTQAKRELKLSDSQIEKIANTLNTPAASAECCAKHAKSAVDGACCANPADHAQQSGQ